MSYTNQDQTDSRGRKLYPAKCSDCGQDCMVPFQPTGERPVYCQSCYKIRKPQYRSDFGKR